MVDRPGRYRALIIAGAGTGMRQSELLGLSLDRVDFLRRTLRVDRQLVTLPRHEPFLASPKTPSSVRTMPVPSVVLETLSAHWRSSGQVRAD